MDPEDRTEVRHMVTDATPVTAACRCLLESGTVHSPICPGNTAASVDYTTCPDCGASVRRSTVHEARFCPMCGSPLPPATEDCPHLSWSGDEGPITELGRFPKRWRCDACGFVSTDA